MRTNEFGKDTEVTTSSDDKLRQRLQSLGISDITPPLNDVWVSNGQPATERENAVVLLDGRV